ncbi:hypothetical protein L195_g043637, partial [Trifolium pratense]
IKDVPSNAPQEKEEKITSDDEGIISIGEYLARADGSYPKNRKFDNGDIVKMRPPNLFNQNAKRRRKWYGPFKIESKCEDKKWLIWDDKLGFAEVEESELEHMEEEDLEEIEKLKKKDDAP